MTIIYISGYGRSGSTLLESVLNNATDTISIGECYRFFQRYYEGTSNCSCGEVIFNCELWKKVDETLRLEIKDYNHIDIWEKIKFLLKFKNQNKIATYLKQKSWKKFVDTVIVFYQSIQKHSNKLILIDSSKSIGWLKVLVAIGFLDLKIIHLERNLIGVTNSWKKRIALPEYTNPIKYMPQKSIFLVVKEWFKVKLMMNKLKHDSYYFMNYNLWIKDFKENTTLLFKYLDLEIREELYFLESHAIAGNPMRKNNNSKIIIRTTNEKFENLNWFEKICINLISIIGKLV